ncbi:MAG: hypothetical protein QM762_25075 [Chryseolinea sp.]
MDTNKLPTGDGTSAVDEYIKIYMNYQNRIHSFYDKDDWEGLVDYINSTEKRMGKNHWLTMQLALAYIQKRDYPRAKRKLAEGLKLHDDCVMVPFLCGIVFLEEGDRNAAIEFFKMLTSLSVDKIVDLASCPCCAEMHQAQTLIADSNFLLAECYSYFGFNDLAKQHRSVHQKAVNNGVRSLYIEDTED